MKNDLVSIIIPTYNRAHLLGETLDSILAQTYTNWECLVIDDGSEDYTCELMEFYTSLDSRIKFFKKPRELKKGANSCRNYGYYLSRGAYINWFDSDDIMHPEKLQSQLSVLQNRKLDIVVCLSMIFESHVNNQIGLRHKNIISPNLLEDYLVKRIFIGTIAPIWRKDFLSESAELFDEELQAAQEWEFFTRLLSRNPKAGAIHIPLVFIRQHEENVTNKRESEVTKWNYFLARLKVYQNQRIPKTSLARNYLENYLLYYFKNVTIRHLHRYSWRTYRLYVLKADHISIQGKFYGMLAILSYSLFNKGYFFISKINRKDKAD